MGDYLKIAVQLQSGKQVVFEDIVFSENYLLESDGILLKIGSEMPYPVEARPLDNSETITSLEFTFYTEIRNYHSVIVPDSGRWFFNSSKIVTFWRSFRELETGVDDTKLPLYIFTGRDRNTALAAGDRKSTRLNSSHVKISYAVFCLKKKKKSWFGSSTEL